MNCIALILCCATALPGGANLTADEQPPTAARLGDMTCTARLRDNESSPPRTLVEPRDHARLFLAGQQVQCASKSGYLVIMLATGPRRITSDDSWFTIPTLELQAKQANYRELRGMALAHHSPRPAASRSGSDSTNFGITVYPTPYGTVSADQFMIRWKPFTKPVRIRFRIGAPGATEAIWTGEADASAGVLDSPEARAALLNYRRQHEGELLMLDWTSGDESDSVPFAILPTPDERILKQELGFWDETTDELTRSLGRAYSLDVRKLYWEAAREYEAALKVAQESCTLLEEARDAEYTAGNADRGAQLQRSIDKVPGGCSPSR